MTGQARIGLSRTSVAVRQQNAKGGALAGVAGDFDFAAVGFDDGFALVHADPDPALLGGLERTEEIAADEIGGHAAAVV